MTGVTPVSAVLLVLGALAGKSSVTVRPTPVLDALAFALLQL